MCASAKAWTVFDMPCFRRGWLVHKPCLSKDLHKRGPCNECDVPLSLVSTNTCKHEAFASFLNSPCTLREMMLAHKSKLCFSRSYNTHSTRPHAGTETKPLHSHPCHSPLKLGCRCVRFSSGGKCLVSFPTLFANTRSFCCPNEAKIEQLM